MFEAVSFTLAMVSFHQAGPEPGGGTLGGGWDTSGRGGGMDKSVEEVGPSGSNPGGGMTENRSTGGGGWFIIGGGRETVGGGS